MTMTHFPTILRAEAAELRAEAESLLNTAVTEKRSLHEPEATRVDELLADIAAKQHRADELDALEVERKAAPVFHINRSTDPWEAPLTVADSSSEVRSRAIAAIEQWRADDAIKESAVATVTRAGADMDAGEASTDVRGVAGHVLMYSHPLYVAAFRKYARDPESYVADLTAEESRFWRAAREQQRATLGTSGAVLPSPLDPSIVLTNNGAADPMRSLCRVDTTVAKEKRYITSAGSAFSYDAELTEVSDDTFTETEVTVSTEKAQGWIEASLEVWMDQPDFDSEVVKIIGDGRARLDAAKFVTGTGTNEPFGIEVSLNSTASEINAAGEALTADDVYALLEALPPRFRESATWQMELSTANFIRRLYNPSGTEPALIEGTNMLGVPFRLNSSIDPYSAVNAAATATNRVLFVGDWRHMVILDRIGTSVYFVPPGVIANTTANRPDGRVGWYAAWRTGAKVLTTAAFRMLDVATTA